MVLEKTLENPLDCKEVQPVHPKGDQSFGRNEELYSEAIAKKMATKSSGGNKEATADIHQDLRGECGQGT